MDENSERYSRKADYEVDGNRTYRRRGGTLIGGGLVVFGLMGATASCLAGGYRSAKGGDGLETTAMSIPFIVAAGIGGNLEFGPGGGARTFKVAGLAAAISFGLGYGSGYLLN